MEEFKKIIDTYFLNYNSYENGKVEFNSDYGELVFLKSERNMITLFAIYIHPEYRYLSMNNSRDLYTYFRLPWSMIKFDIV